MTKPILVTASPLPASFLTLLTTVAEVREFDSARADEILAGASIWLGTAMDPVPATRIDSFPNTLGLIANLGVGTDNVDLDAAARAGIEVSNTPVVTEDTADLTMALLLGTARRLGECERLLRDGQWAIGAATLGKRVHGATLGIVGFGAIGQALAKRARGFEMNLIYHGPNRKLAAEQELGAEYRGSLSSLLNDADFVSLNCPLTNHTHHIINAQTLACMRKDAILINTGRGPLIDEDALVTALDQGRLGGAGLDVFEFEPRVHPALNKMNNVVLLPHIGSATNACRADIATRVMQNIRAFLDSGIPLDRCTP